jgi:hypothetical protein
MFRFAVLIALLFAATPIHAQAGALHHPSDPRLVVRVETPAAAEPRPAYELADGSRWKAGAVTGGILGGIVGFALGFGMDNVINEGKMSAGENSAAGTLLGAAGGALLGAGIGSLIRR